MPNQRRKTIPVLSLLGKLSRTVSLHEAENSLIYRLTRCMRSSTLTKERDSYVKAMFIWIQIVVRKQHELLLISRPLFAGVGSRDILT